jgi:hypothetical protein
MSTRIFKMAVVVSMAVLQGMSYGELWSRTSPNVRLTTSSDKVGIGTSTIGSKLQVNGNAAVGYSASTAAPSNGLAVSGNMGIGTTTVGSKLQVNGNAAIGYSASTAAPTNGLIVSGKVGIGTTNPDVPLAVVGGATGYAMHVMTTGTGDNGALILSSGSTGSATTLSVQNWMGGNAAYFAGKITMMAANVGINKDPGTEALEVAGNIKCNAVKINNWTIEAPDYVFEKDYQLPSLKSVEKHIAAEKHLPGVPSAADMKKNGVDLSEMNMTLLKKVEELTLYVIEQNKKIEALERKVSE